MAIKGENVTCWERLALGPCLALLLALGCGDDGATSDRGDGGTSDGGVSMRDAASDLDGGELPDGAASARDAGADGGGQESDASRPAITPEEFCELLFEKAQLELCDSGESEAECRTQLQGRDGYQRCNALVEAVDAGRLRFDGAVVLECLDVDDRTLAQFFDGFSFDCPGAFTGTLDEGADCYFDHGFNASECAPELYCERGDSCPGQCRPYQQMGDSCPSAGRCAPELACLRDCTLPCEGECGPRPGEGEDCERAGGLCEEGLICDATVSPYTCIVPRELGEDCTAHYQCASVRCLDGECAPALMHECDHAWDCDDDETCQWEETVRLCVPRRSEGEPCTEGADQCAQGLTCMYNFEDDQAYCREHAGLDGDPCLPWGCEPELYCAIEGEDLVCRPDHGMGETCTDYSFDLSVFNSPCTEGLHCMFSSTGTCLPPSSLGGPCYYNDGESCEAGLVCMGYAMSECTVPSDVGEDCNVVFESACDGGYCACVDDGEGGCGWECFALLEDGEPCSEPRMCVSDFCDFSAGLEEGVCGPKPVEPPLCLP